MHNYKECFRTAREGNVTWQDKDSTSTITMIQKKDIRTLHTYNFYDFLKLRPQKDKGCSRTAHKGNSTWLDKDSISAITLIEQKII